MGRDGAFQTQRFWSLECVWFALRLCAGSTFDLDGQGITCLYGFCDCCLEEGGGGGKEWGIADFFFFVIAVWSLVWRDVWARAPLPGSPRQSPGRELCGGGVRTGPWGLCP